MPAMQNKAAGGERVRIPTSCCDSMSTEINQEVAENRDIKPPRAQQAAVACDEAADPATEYMAVHG
jgi:hypothetical protein